jgi:hypothetical protein
VLLHGQLSQESSIAIGGPGYETLDAFAAHFDLQAI